VPTPCALLKRFIQGSPRHHVCVVVHGLQSDPQDHFKELGFGESGLKKPLSRLVGNPAVLTDDFLSEKMERFEFRVGKRFAFPEPVNNIRRYTKHLRHGRVAGHTVVGNVLEADGQEHHTPFRLGKCGLSEMAEELHKTQNRGRRLGHLAEHIRKEARLG